MTRAPDPRIPPLQILLERDVLPALYVRLDRAFPEQGWKRQEDGSWRSAQGDTCNGPFAVETRDGRIYSFLAWVSERREPRGHALATAVGLLAEVAQIPHAPRAFGEDEVRVYTSMPQLRETLAALGRSAAQLLAGRAGAAWRARLAKQGLPSMACGELGLGYYSSVSEVRSGLPPGHHDAARSKGLLDERWAGCLLVPWRDAWRRAVGFLVVRADTTWEPWLLDPCGHATLLHLDQALTTGARRLLLAPDPLSALLLQARGERGAVWSPTLPLGPEQRTSLVNQGVQSVTLCLPRGASHAVLAGMEDLPERGVGVYVVETRDPLPTLLTQEEPVSLAELTAGELCLARHLLEPHLVGLDRSSPRSLVEPALAQARTIVKGMKGPLAEVQREELLGRLCAVTGEPRDRLRRLLRSPGGHSRSGYRETPDGLFYVRRQGEVGEQAVRLANFTCRLEGVEIEDDGRTEAKYALIVVRLAGEEQRLRLEAEEYRSLRWVRKLLDPRALLGVGERTRRRFLEAVIERSGTVPVRRVRKRFGWAHASGQAPVYVHAGGVLGGDGPLEGEEARVPPPLAALKLPPPPEGETLTQAIRASLGFLDVGPRSVTVPLLAAAWRAAMGGASLALRVGVSPALQVALAEALFGHWGAGALPVPLEGLVRSELSDGGADLLLTVVTGSDGSVPATWRGPLLVVGPAVPGVRTLLCEEGSFDSAALARTRQDARAGRLAQAMAGFVVWLASPRGADVLSSARRIDARPAAQPRDELELGLSTLLRFAVEVGVVSALESRSLLVQLQSTTTGRQPACLVELLRDCLARGQAHLQAPGGGPPAADPARWGWRPSSSGEGWSAQGAALGWVKRDEVLLLPEATHTVLTAAAGKNLPLPGRPDQLGRLFETAGYLKRTSASRNTPCVRLEVRRKSHSVLALSVALFPAPEPPLRPVAPPIEPEAGYLDEAVA